VILMVMGLLAFKIYWYFYQWEEHEFKAFQELVQELDLKYEYIANTHRGLASVRIL